jgi:hypothetical protein
MRPLHVLQADRLQSKHLDVDQLQLASPCHAKWKDMRGDDRTRLCLSCEKNVYNLASMTRREIHALIVETEGQFCGRLYKRKDGTVLTADCPLGIREKVGIAAHRLSLTLFLAAMAVALAVLALVPRPKTCATKTPIVELNTHPVVEQRVPRPVVKRPVLSDDAPRVIERLEDGLRRRVEQAQSELEDTRPRKGGMG